MTSEWATINAELPQGTLFLIAGFVVFINDLQTELHVFKYVDDCTIWESCPLSGADSRLQAACTQVVQWSERNLMKLNCDKTKEMLIYFSRKDPDIPAITVNNVQIERVGSFKLLGVTKTSDLKWDTHVTNVHRKACQRRYFLRLLKRAGVDGSSMIQIYMSIIKSLLESLSSASRRLYTSLTPTVL